MPLANKIEDWLPEDLRQRLGLIDLRTALYQVHFPSSNKEIINSQRRLTFYRIIFTSTKIPSIKRELKNLSAPVINFNEEITRGFVSGLPFPLTNDQKKAAWENFKRLAKKPTNVTAIRR